MTKIIIKSYKILKKNHLTKEYTFFMEKSLSEIYVQKNATFKHQRKIYTLDKNKKSLHLKYLKINPLNRLVKK